MARITRDARAASRGAARAPAKERERAMRATAARLGATAGRILAENDADLAAAARSGLAEAMLDRLRLDEGRLRGMADALLEVADRPDPVGAIDRMWRRPNGLLVGKMRIPLGVVAVIYEARPNVTTDAFGLCLRSGNAVVLRGGSEAIRTNRALGEAIAAGLAEAGLPPAVAQVMPMTDREAIEHLIRREDDLDLVIPRGGEGLIRFVVERSRVPVVKHYKGVCHIYVDAAADVEMAATICENAKVQRPGVCNAVETILVHEAVAERAVPVLAARLQARGVEIRGDERARQLGGSAIVPATDEDWAAEYLALIVALRVVPSLDEAVAHIERWGSQHTEAIVTGDYAAAHRFLDEVASSTVLVNASTRFADGGELGLGAEIGISTSKTHAFGPMGADELTTTKFVVMGQGQIRT